MRRERRRVKRRMWRAEALAAIPLFLAFALLACFVAPFTPYEFHGYANIPEKLCPGERVRFVQNYAVEEGWYYSVESLKISAYWVPEDDSLPPYPNGTSEVPLGPTAGLESEMTPIVRRVPPDPGLWTPRADVVVRGHVGPTPRHQDLAFSAPPVEVLDAGDLACEGVSPADPT